MNLLQTETLNFWDRLIIGAKVTIDGKEQDYPIHESSYIEGNVLKKFVYLDSEVTGKITNAYVYDCDGRPIQEKSMNIKKGADGLMVTLFFRLEVKEE